MNHQSDPPGLAGNPLTVGPAPVPIQEVMLPTQKFS
jgi:hypothetical protein